MENLGVGTAFITKSGLVLKRLINFERIKKLLWSIIRGVLLIGISYIILYPLFVQFTQAIMSRDDMFDITVRFIPKSLTIENFLSAGRALNYWVTLSTTVYLAGVTTLLQVISCTLVGYGFARFKFKGRELLFGLVLLTILVPPQTVVISLFLHFRYFDILGIIKFFTGNTIKLVDTMGPFFLPAATCMGIRNGLYIYIIRQFFRGMPKELEEAALVDGCGVFKTFYTIMLRPAIPAITTVVLFSFVWQWNDIFYISMFVTNFEVMTSALEDMPIKLLAANRYTTSIEAVEINPIDRVRWMATGSLMSLAPLILLYIFAQKYFVESIERTGIVG